MKRIITLLSLLISISAFSTTPAYWKSISAAQAEATGPRLIFVGDAKYVQLDLSALKNYLLSARQTGSNKHGIELSVPMPDGTFQRFNVFESSVMAPELSAKYPNIYTWAGQGIDDRTASIRLDITQWGFHSMIIAASGRYFIDPFNYYTTDTYIVYDHDQELNFRSQMSCGFSVPEFSQVTDPQQELMSNKTQAIGVLLPCGDTLRTYRLALACTGEYANAFPGTITKASTLARMVTSVNRVNEVYEVELAAHLNLIAGDDTLIFLNGNTDPYTNNNGSTMLTENETEVVTVIGNANFDIGHVFSTGGGGIAGLGVVCNNATKAKGVTGSPAPYGDAFDIDYVAHEMGHQFGANHPFNSSLGSCGGGNRNASTAYEIGSGSTIMAYAGICNGDDLQPHSDPYFHTISFDEIRAYGVRNSIGKACAAKQATTNNIPVITSTAITATIPKLTPFMLTGSATDADVADTLTYCWEEFDLGNSTTITAPTGNAPTYRSFNPTTSPTRYFPKLSSILANTTSKGEVMPTYPRTMHFRMTVRDNVAANGGVIYTPTMSTVAVDTASGPFVVTQPNTTGIVWAGLSQQTITWNKANTDVAPVNCANVDILLSIDGGLTYPYTLATSVPNNGTYTVASVPNVQTVKARVMVKANGNIFFDVSNYNHTINLTNAIGENDLQGETVSLYPNPAHQSVEMNWEGTYSGKVDLHIVDAVGREVKAQSFTRMGTKSVQILDLTGLQAGLYSVEASTPKGKVVCKLVVQ